jgi:hypothetical protein
MNENFIRKVLGVEYHRNGVSGEGFHAVEFEATTGINMIAVVFEEGGYCAVLQSDTIHLKWRGDCFEKELRDAIEKFEENRFK